MSALSASLGPLAGSDSRPRLNWLAFLAPMTLVSVGYIDPGNWATDLEGGARFGYRLLWVLVLSNAMAILLQVLSAKLRIVSGLDLATACRQHYSKPVSVALWLLAECAIIACDMAEILGSAVALNLLFGLPMIAGAIITVLDVLLIFWLQRYGARTLEAIVAALMLTIALCVAAQVVMASPSATDVLSGLRPSIDGASLYIAIAILGATVMPHNLYLHSAIVRPEFAAMDDGAKRKALRSSVIGTTFALNIALVLNGGILVLAAAVFSVRGLSITDLRQAHALLDPLLGVGLASVLFAVGLLCSGQSATITGTLAGQIVMEGFVKLRVSPVLRRALTRGLAVIPALIVLIVAGESGTMPLLVASQVILSLQLPFAIVPLVRLTSSRALMGRFANSRSVMWVAGACAVIVTSANAALVYRVVFSGHDGNALVSGASLLVALCGFGLLLFVSLVPLRSNPKEAPQPMLALHG